MTQRDTTSADTRHQTGGLYRIKKAVLKCPDKHCTGTRQLIRINFIYFITHAVIKIPIDADEGSVYRLTIYSANLRANIMNLCLKQVVKVFSIFQETVIELITKVCKI